VSRIRIANYKDARFSLEDFTNLVRAQMPHLSYFDDRIVTLSGYDIFLLY
jgi:hypothetical protein